MSTSSYIMYLLQYHIMNTKTVRVPKCVSVMVKNWTSQSCITLHLFSDEKTTQYAIVT